MEPITNPTDSQPKTSPMFFTPLQILALTERCKFTQSCWIPISNIEADTHQIPTRIWRSTTPETRGVRQATTHTAA